MYTVSSPGRYSREGVNFFRCRGQEGKVNREGSYSRGGGIFKEIRQVGFFRALLLDYYGHAVTLRLMIYIVVDCSDLKILRDERTWWSWMPCTSRPSLTVQSHCNADASAWIYCNLVLPV